MGLCGEIVIGYSLVHVHFTIHQAFKEMTEKTFADRHETTIFVKSGVV